MHPVTSQAPSPEVNKSSYHKVFNYSYEAVWRAAQLTLKYPIAVNNIDNGVLETEWIRSSDGFIAPGAIKEPSAGSKYKIPIADAGG